MICTGSLKPPHPSPQPVIWPEPRLEALHARVTRGLVKNGCAVCLDAGCCLARPGQTRWVWEGRSWSRLNWMC